MCAVREVTLFRDGNHNTGATIFTSANSAMRAPYGLTILDNCVTCPVREEHLFCNLPLPAVKKLNEIKSTAVYPKSTMLFIEGVKSRSVLQNNSAGTTTQLMRKSARWDLPVLLQRNLRNCCFPGNPKKQEPMALSKSS